MLKGAIFLLCIMLSPSLLAQNERNDSIVHDTLTTGKQKRGFTKAIKKFLNFSDFDTTYISPNRYNYAFMLDHFTNYEYYSVGTNMPEPQQLRFTPQPSQQDRGLLRMAVDILGMVGRYGRTGGKEEQGKQRNGIRPQPL